MLIDRPAFLFFLHNVKSAFGSAFSINPFQGINDARRVIQILRGQNRKMVAQTTVSWCQTWQKP